LEKRRLDVLLVDRGLAESRARAQWLIREGRVRVAGRPVIRPGETVPSDTPIEVTEPLPYVSRGGVKLAHALDTFRVAIRGRIALDVGASTGGFTDCLLQRGAARVYAVDVGREQLHSRLREDPRVVSLESTDIRNLPALPGGVLAGIAVIDVSFISLRLVLPAALRLLQLDGEIVALVKPQFEVGPGVVGHSGVVRQRADRERALREVLSLAEELGLVPAGLCPAPMDETRGNVEYLAYLRREGPGVELGPAILQALQV
jgi:23S rRNA (cytidine1920-2'-O)/16S rRNA (cytidine1409-2'-O)-methyltransferase